MLRTATAAPLGLEIIEVAVGLKRLALGTVLTAVKLGHQGLLQLELVIRMHDKPSDEVDRCKQATDQCKGNVDRGHLVNDFLFRTLF
jgi:hypothetical protein